MSEIYVVFLSVPSNTDKERFEQEQIETVQNILGADQPMQKVMKIIGTFEDDDVHGHLSGEVLRGKSLLPMLEIEAIFLTLSEELKVLNKNLEVLSIFQIDVEEYILIVQQKNNEIYFKISVQDLAKCTMQKYINGKFQHISMTENLLKNLVKELLVHS